MAVIEALRRTDKKRFRALDNPLLRILGKTGQEFHVFTVRFCLAVVDELSAAAFTDAAIPVVVASPGAIV